LFLKTPCGYFGLQRYDLASLLQALF
jgi:hypothetical protein